MANARNFTASFATLATLMAGAAALPVPAFGQAVGDATLSDLRVDNVGGCTRLTINFNIRIQMLSHFPQTGGRELHVRIQPIDQIQTTQAKESLRSPATVPSLRSVEFEGNNPSGPVLSLYFTRDTKFDVQPGDRPQSLVILIAEPGTGLACGATPTGGTMPATGAATGQPSRPALAAIAIPSGLYIVNLASQAGGAPILDADQSQAVAGKVLYETRFERDGQQWHRLRMGFYDTREQAEAARAKLASRFPDAWVLKVAAEERSEGVASRMDTGAAPISGGSAATMAPAPAATEAERAETARIITDAEQAIKDGNPDRAVQLLLGATAKPQSDKTPRALELLALTHERKGQMAHAQAEYEEYLRRFPSGEAAERVQQRLAALTGTAGGGAGQPLRAASGTSRTSKAWNWSERGSFSQFYFRDQSTTKFLDAAKLVVNPDVSDAVNLNQLLTSADLTITGGNDRRQVQIRASGSYAKSFGTPFSLNTTNSVGQIITRLGTGKSTDLKSLTALYVDYSDRDLHLSTRIGRQTRNSDGVLGRFDGGLVSWQANPKLRFNVVAGVPVLSSRQMEILSDRKFYGVSVNLGQRRSALQTSFYWFDQRASGGFIDRQAVGFESRYLKKNFNGFTIIDYDVKHKRLNLGLLTLNYTFPDHSSLSATADYRQSPLLTTHNALIGMFTNDLQPQPITTLAGLRPYFTDPQIYQLALDRTLVTKSYSVTYSRPLTKKLQANVDFNMTDTGGNPDTPATPATLATLTQPATTGTASVFGIPATGREFYYGAQLIGSGLLWENDIYIMSGRYADTQRSRIYTADINARVPISTKFRLSPRLRYGYRSNKFDAGTFHQFQPTLQFNYYPLRHSEVEIEFGANFSTEKAYQSGALVTSKEQGFVLSAGYRLDF